MTDLTISEDRPDQLALRRGDRLGGYEVAELIGRGGMGDVYRAIDPELGRPIALKLIAPHLASDDRFRKRFEREWHTVAALDHPNVVTVYRLAPQDAVSIVEQAAAGLDAAHAAGLVHRDVKPGNILIGDEGRVR